MISKSSKFPTRTQFLQFRARAKQFTTPHLRVMVDHHNPSRLSVIAPIKVSKRAVVRNYFKRFMYDAAWKIIQDQNIDCIVMFKPITLQKSPATKQLLLSELSSLFLNPNS